MKFFKRFSLIIILFILFFVITANSYAKAISDNLSDSFFRLHIIANSNNEEDQELKLKIRDHIIEYMKTLSYNKSSKEEIIQITNEHLSDFKKIAEEVIQKNGYNYKVSINVGNYYFPTKNYGNLSLPAGNYDALKIGIGNAIGENWWCSLFPPLCFVDISSGVIDSNGEKYLEENLNDESFAIVTENSNQVKLKFKILEIFSK